MGEGIMTFSKVNRIFIQFDLKNKYKKKTIKHVEKNKGLNKWKDIHVHGLEDIML